MISFNRKRSQLQAYFAGLFDGEGCVQVNVYTKTTGAKELTVRVTIEMTEPIGVALLHKHYGGYFKKIDSNNFPSKQGKYSNMKPRYHWQLYGLSCYDFLKEIEPFVLIKWEQVKVTLSWLSYYRQEQANRKNLIGGTAGRPYSKEFWEKAERTDNILRKLKIPEINGVNSVDILSRHEMRQYRSKPEEVADDIKYLRELLEGVETRLSESNKAISSPEKDIVHR